MGGYLEINPLPMLEFMLGVVMKAQNQPPRLLGKQGHLILSLVISK